MAITHTSIPAYIPTGNNFELVVSTTTTGVSDHRLHISATVTDAAGNALFTFTDQLPVIDSQATFYLNQYLQKKITGHFEKLLGKASKYTNLVYKYVVDEIWESYNYLDTHQNAVTSTTEYFAIQSTVSDELQKLWKAQSKNLYTEWLTPGKFLSTTPESIILNLQESFHIYWLALAIGTYSLRADVTFSDASTATLTLGTTTTTVAGTVCEFQCSYADKKLSAQEIAKTIVSYQVYVYNGTSTVSNTITITLNRTYYPTIMQFIFLNELGMYDYLSMVGASSKQNTIDIQAGVYNEISVAARKKRKQQFSAQTTYYVRDTAYIEWLSGTIRSTDAYHVDGGYVYSILISNENDTPQRSQSFMHLYSISFTHENLAALLTDKLPGTFDSTITRFSSTEVTFDRTS